MKRKLQFTAKLALASMMVAATLSGSKTFAQSQVRSYATRQGIAIGGISLTTTDSAANAVDVNPLTASHLTLGVGIAGSMTQYLDFNPSSSATGSYATTIAANTPITVKFNLPSGLVSALGSVEIQAITNLHTTLGIWGATNVGTAYSGSSLVGLLTGAGSMEYTITPTAAFQGIRVTISGLASVGVGIDVYDAYIKTSTPSTVCNSAIDLLSGVRAGATAGIANATGGVVNPGNLIDGNTTNYSQLNTGVQLLSNVYQTVIFNTTSKIGDSLKISLQDASLNLLNLSALAGVTINLYNGSNGAPVQTLLNTSNLLTLHVLDSTSAMEQLSFVPSVVFDRVEVQLGGVTGALQSLRLYSIARKNAGVSLTAAQKDIYAYTGQNLVLGSSVIATGDVISYYDAPTGGNLLTSNTVATTLAQANTVIPFYASTTRNGCSEASDRKLINGHVIPFTYATPNSGHINTLYASTVAVAPTGTPSGLPNTPVYVYSTTSTLPTGLTMNPNTGAITGTPTTSGTYPLVVNVTDQANNIPVGTFAYDLVIGSTPLATNLIAFSGNATGGAVQLSWTIAPEAQNKAYDIERGNDGRSFNKIGSVAAATGKQVFSYTDKTASNGINFYRIKVTETNGDVTYSSTVSVNLNAVSGIDVYPNPLEGNVLFVKGSNVKSIKISNAVGQTVAVPVHYASDLQQIETQSLGKGIYMLSIQRADGNITTSRFIVK
jgi:hypothetical protein